MIGVAGLLYAAASALVYELVHDPFRILGQAGRAHEPNGQNALICNLGNLDVAPAEMAFFRLYTDHDFS